MVELGGENSSRLVLGGLDGQSVPVKDGVDAAIKAYQEANAGAIPDYVLSFNIPMRYYYKWTDSGNMIHVKHLCGYRIKSDLNLNELDPEWMAASAAASAGPVEDERIEDAAAASAAVPIQFGFDSLLLSMM